MLNYDREMYDIWWIQITNNQILNSISNKLFLIITLLIGKITNCNYLKI